MGLGTPLPALAVVLILKWPFNPARTVRSLEHFTASSVRIETFHRIYIPRPGYVAGHITFSRQSKNGGTQLAVVERLECKGSWWSMLSLTHHVEELDIQGLQVTIPAEVPPPMRLHPDVKEQISFSKLNADGAVLEIAPRHAGQHPLRFLFPQLTLEDIEKNKPMQLQTVMRNPEPPADLAITAAVGPFAFGAVGQTKMSGSFYFTHGDLSGFHAIRGMLAAQARFGGTLARCQIQGHARIPDFEVMSSRHPVDVAAEFAAIVDGEHGNVTIQSVAAHFLHTTLQASGAIQDRAGDAGKRVTLALKAEHGRVEDLLRLFARSDPPAMEGPLTFRAQAQLPAGDAPFLRRVHLDGDFAIKEASFTKKQTQEKVNELSHRARNGKSQREETLPRVTSGLKGHVHLQNASGKLSDLYFSTPGATARGEGTYDVLTQKIDLSGKLAMQASLSKAAGGVKSILLIPLNPFFKRENAGSVLPVRITGDYSHPLFRLSLRKRQ